MHTKTLRTWLIRWIYLLTFSHFVAGILLTWFANLALFDHYHHSILVQFAILSDAARQLQIWWLSLFGATLQNLAIFMGILTFVASKQRIAYIWAGMIAGLIVWAPQDMLISMQIDLWIHVWVDALVLVLMLPPLIVLYWLDRATPQLIISPAANRSS